ncbi:MAG TPA: glycosyltransferase family 39 protein [Steroidobacteraceae bacterium]|nr:glycosyltransferase family 39 protein [Steroidobacteraceae bacterium]
MAGWLQGAASLFEVTPPRARADRRTLVLLAVILIVGAAVRFWGLGNVGLHGDEKTMALPTLHLINYGTPEMPSGFLYPRAVPQLYLMAGSVLAFGDSAWALRLPSAICGVLLILLAWGAGRRFLEPRWNLALTAVVALLPAFIEDAQTARMYVFLVAGVTGFLALLFAWERTGRGGYLVAAVLEMAVSLLFHTLSVFTAWLCFLPGLLSGERRKLAQGAGAFVAIAAEYLALDRWQKMEYPHALLGAIAGTPINAPRALPPPLHLLWPLALALPALALAWYVIRERGWWPTALLAASLVLQVSRLDHVAILLLIAALVLARRNGRLRLPRVALYFGVCALLAAWQVGYLLAHHAGTLSQILGLLLGWPSVRAYLATSMYSQAALLIAACGLAAGLWRLAHRERVPDHLLFLTLGVWIPLLQIGYFMWDPEQRYVEGQVIPLLIAALASAQWAARALARARASGVGDSGRRPSGAVRYGALAALVLSLLVIDPARLPAAVDPTYAHYPDHQGAARFVESRHPGPDDIIVAEDALMQTYYLGHVNYWLQDREVAAPFLRKVDGRWVDEYTGAPLIGSGAELKRLVASRDRGAIYVIGSGENQKDGRKLMRGLGIAQVLDSSAFHLVYVGRDGLTDVWKVAPPRRGLTAADQRPVRR